MNRVFQTIVVAAGLAVCGWVGAGYGGTNPLALGVVVLIAACYLAGVLELHRFQQATSTLTRAVDQAAEPPASLGVWLDVLHPSLRAAVRARIEGERAGLPGPALTPYLVGLLVLLGMLGTFLGMVVTLNGTGRALQSATDLEAIRASLAAPVKGLGLAFGTSVAGVATSAMLGLLSALARRERLQAVQRLDARIATTLRAYSLSQRREQSLLLQQQQAELMPQLIDRLQAMMAALERQGQDLGERLVANQRSFHDQAGAAYAGLAASVDQSLQKSLTEGARAAGATIQPVVEATMAGIARETVALQGAVARTVQQQLDGISSRFDTAAAALVEQVAGRLDSAVGGLSDHWRGALAQHQRASEQLSDHTQQALAAATAGFERQAASLLHTVNEAHANLQAGMASRDEARLAAWTGTLASMAASLREQWQQAGAHTAQQQQAVCDTLARTAHDITAQAESQAQRTIAEIAQLVQAASQAPRAAAEVIAELRQKLADSMARDNAMLDERSRILETLGTLLGAVNHASTEQRAAIEALVGTSSDLLERVGSRFTEQADDQSGRMAAAAAQLTASAVEVASLGEAFGTAVQQFGQSSDKLVGQMQRIEGALGKSLSRSDEQLAYYVAQAREVIDLSIMSQKQIVEDLQQIAARAVPEGSAA